MKPKRPELTLLATVTTLLGGLLWIGGICLTIGAFNRSNPTPYSFWNHFVSGLGFPETSSLTWLYNGADAIAGLLALPLIYVIGLRLESRLGWLSTTFGAATFLILSFIGVLGLQQDFLHPKYFSFPFFEAHLVAAVAFFLAWLITLTLFTAGFIRQARDRAAFTMALVGGLCWLVCVGLLTSGAYTFFVKLNQHGSSRDPFFEMLVHSKATPKMLNEWLEAHRPPVLWPAVMEWSLVSSVLIWQVFALHFIRVKPNKKST